MIQAAQSVTPKTRSTVDQLLHDAESAHAGREMALACRDLFHANKLLTKSRRLWDQAEAIDPNHRDPAWKQTRLQGRP